MSQGNVLVTGGAGFIGSHTVDLLLAKGYDVTVLDSLEPPTHQTPDFPSYLSSKCRRVKGSVLSRSLLEELCSDAEAVIHLAALVGPYQSMYQIEKYVDINTRGSANLLDVLVNSKTSVKKLILASSMMVYGEGTYQCSTCSKIYNPGVRDEKNLKQRNYDHFCPSCNTPLTPIPTSETRPTCPVSIYAVSKRQQEELCLLVGRTYDIPVTALRYFNVYGSRQSLSNPYTGVCAIFTTRILSNQPPLLFEDGLMMRDFVHVSDIARANLMALEANGTADYEVLNIGSGVATTTLELARILTKLYDSKIKAVISNSHRKNDTRQCHADVTKARRLLGFEAEVNLETGLRELTQWGKLNQGSAIDQFDTATRELSERNLLS
jgi:dTDP-L-rhamnose 4-epimerase